MKCRWLPIGVLAASAMLTPAARSQGVPSLEAIGRAHERMLASIKNLRVQYRSEPVAIVDPAVLYQIQGAYELPPSDFTFVVASDGRTYRSLRGQRKQMGDIVRWWQQKNPSVKADPTKLTYAQVREALPKVGKTTLEWIDLFDGQRLIDKDPEKLKPMGVEHTIYGVVYIPRLESAHFPETPLDFSLVSFPCPGLPKDDELRRRHRIPAMIADRSLTLAAGRQRVGLDECVVLKQDDRQTLWLDPARGYAPRRREFFLEGSLILRVECEDYRDLDATVRLPGRVIVTEIGGKGFVPPAQEGAELVRTTYTLANPVLNASSNEVYFRFSPTGGDVVVDETLADESKRGTTEKREGTSKIRSTIAYTTPANIEDLDRVARAAVEAERNRDRPWWTHPLLWINAGGLAVVAVVVLVRRRRPEAGRGAA